MSSAHNHPGYQAPSITAAGLALLLAVCAEHPEVEGPSADPMSPPAPASAPTRRCQVVASIPYWDQPRATRSLRGNIELIDYVSVFWYHLTPSGEIQTYARARPSQTLIRFAQERGAKVLALVANLPDDEREGGGLTWDSSRVAAVLRPASARQAHVEALVRLADRVGFDGIHIDYEGLPKSERDDFTAFIAELGGALRAQGKLLAVAVHNKTSENNPKEDNGSWAQDWTALVKHVDQLHLMTYSQHTAESNPGPLASLRWFEPILAYAASGLGLPARKIYVGLPLYAEEWHRDRGGRYVGLDIDFTYRDVQHRILRSGGRETWSTKHASPYARYRENPDHEHVVWFENARSSARKLEAIRRAGLCNVALWRLGGEDPKVWPALREWLDQARQKGGGDE